MRRRGRTTLHAKPRRRKLARLLMIPVAIIAAMAVYFLFFKTPDAHIVWQHEFTIPMDFAQVESFPDGRMAVVGREAIEFLDQHGNTYAGPYLVNDRAFPPRHDPITDSKHNLYLAYDYHLRSYDTEGNLRWIVKLPDTTCFAGMFRNTYTSIINDDLIVVTDGVCNFTKVNSSGEIVCAYTESEVPERQYTSMAMPINNNQYAVFSHDLNFPNEQHYLSIIDDSGVIKTQFPIPLNYPFDIVQFEDRILFSTGSLYMIDESGNILWQYTNPDKSFPKGYGHPFYYESINNVVYITSGRYVFACTIDGTVLWELTLNDTRDIAALSADVQYVLDCDVSDILLKLYSNTVQALRGRSAGLSNHVPYPATKCELVRIEHGKVSKRWRLPDDIYSIDGSDDAGRLYLYSSLDNTMYCVEP